MERTKGRIQVRHDRLLEFVAEPVEDSVPMAEVYDTTEGLEGDDPEADANAEHLAACWNAIEDANIENPAVLPELLAATRGLIEFCATIVLDNPQPHETLCGLYSSVEKMLDKLKGGGS